MNMYEQLEKFSQQLKLLEEAHSWRFTYFVLRFQIQIAKDEKNLNFV